MSEEESQTAGLEQHECKRHLNIHVCVKYWFN